MRIHILKFASLFRYQPHQNDQEFHLNADGKQYFCVQNQESYEE